MYEKYQVIVFVEVQLIKNIFLKDEQTRSTQNVVNTSMFKSEYYSIWKACELLRKIMTFSKKCNQKSIISPTKTQNTHKVRKFPQKASRSL